MKPQCANPVPLLQVKVLREDMEFLCIISGIKVFTPV